jgi:hypothetical protein
VNGRVLICRVCRDRVRVYELPGPFIDPDLYVCGECLRPVEDERGEQLSLVREGREEVRDYDPTIAEIPF